MNEIVTIIVGAVLSGLTMYFEYQRKNRDMEYSLKLEELKNSQGNTSIEQKQFYVVMLRHIIESTYDKCYAKNYCSKEEYENLTEAYNLYAGLGENHNGERMYNAVKELYYKSLDDERSNYDN